MRVAILVGALLAITPAASALTLLAVDAPLAGEVLVGYREGGLDATLASIASLGGQVLRTNQDLRFIVVETRDTARFLGGIALALTVEFVETNDVTRLHGAQWNGAQWNGAQWNGAQWNGAQWNADDMDAADPGAEWQWGLHAVRAPQAWNVTSGERRASLCVLDSGVDLAHRDLAGAIVETHNAIDPRESAADDAGHGTHVAGIAAAEIGNKFGTAGVGNVRILPVKVLSADGTGQEDDLAAGIVWCANAGASVAVMALSVDDEGPTLRKAIEYAKARDVLMLASAGNGGSTSAVAFPARHADVVAVGALDQSLRPAAFSARGPQVELAAPGVDILSTFRGDEFRYGSGTSQAVAFAAGAAALLRDAEPGLSASQTRERLGATAQDVGASGRDHATGRGLVDVAAAVR